VFGKILPPEEQVLLEQAWSQLARSKSEPRYHPSRSALLWHNPCFGVRMRAKVRAKRHFNAQNSHLSLYPEMLDELLKYVFIPQKLSIAYRAHRAEIQSGAKPRP
jgi:hypothetical protein